MTAACRMRVTLDDDGAHVGYIQGDPEFYPNLNDVYDYECDWHNLKAIVDHVKNGTDGSHSMFKYLNGAPNIVLHKQEKDQDENGRLYSKLEREIFRNCEFEAFVNPSPGTVYRFVKIRKSYCMSKGVFNVFFVVPDGYPIRCGKCVADDFDAYMASVKLAVKTSGLKYVAKFAKWCELPPDMELYFASNGHILHTYNYKGVGLELNPYVAATVNLSLVSFDEHDNVVTVKYVKNAKTITFDYVNDPVAYRIHGSDYCVDRSGYDAGLLNLFNVVTCNRLASLTRVSLTLSTQYAYCPGNIIVPQIVKERIDGSFVFGTDVDDNVCDILSPPYELSTRTHLLGVLGIARPLYVDGDFSVLSSIASTIVQIKSSDNLSKMRYEVVVHAFPSKWWFNGQQWSLRVYPEAIRGDILGLSQTEFYIPDRESWEKVPSSLYYDENLKYVLQPGNFVACGVVTTLYVRSNTGVPMLRVMNPVKLKESNYVSILRLRMPAAVSNCSKSASKRRRKRKNASLKKKIRKNERNYEEITRNDKRLLLLDCKLADTAMFVRELDDLFVLEFESPSRACTFYHANIDRFSLRMWCGDLTQFYNFVDPRNGTEILVPNTKLFTDDWNYSVPLKLENVYKHTYDKDLVCNYTYNHEVSEHADVFDMTDDL
jgi:hypothetical protein